MKSIDPGGACVRDNVIDGLSSLCIVRRGCGQSDGGTARVAIRRSAADHQRGGAAGWIPPHSCFTIVLSIFIRIVLAIILPVVIKVVFAVVLLAVVLLAVVLLAVVLLAVVLFTELVLPLLLIAIIVIVRLVVFEVVLPILLFTEHVIPLIPLVLALVQQLLALSGLCCVRRHVLALIYQILPGRR